MSDVVIKFIDRAGVVQSGIISGGFAAGSTAEWTDVDDSTLATKTALAAVKATADAALPAPEAPATNVADLTANFANTDINDGGTLDGTEIAAALNATNAALNAVKDALVAAGLMAAE